MVRTQPSILSLIRICVWATGQPHNEEIDDHADMILRNYASASTSTSHRGKREPTPPLPPPNME